jgi:hypothetical protein
MTRPTDRANSSDLSRSIKGIKSPLAGLRFHDLRHHAITELAESQASDATVMSICFAQDVPAYLHVRLQTERTALDSLSMNRPAVSDFEGRMEGYGTDHVTKEPTTEASGWKLVGSLVELSGIEPLTSSLRTRRSPS